MVVERGVDGFVDEEGVVGSYEAIDAINDGEVGADDEEDVRGGL